MNIYKLLLCLYPLVWRDRYEEEFLAVLASHPFSLFEGVDVVRGALDAHLHPDLGTAEMPAPEKMGRMLSMLRCSLLTIFCAYVGFILAGFGFQKMTESVAFQQVAQTHSTVGLSFYSIVIGAIVALLAVLAGGLPIVFVVIRSALARKRYGPLLLLAVPLLALAAIVGFIFLLKAIDHLGYSMSPFWNLLLHRGFFFGLLIAAAIASLRAVWLAVVRSEISENILHFAVLPSILTTLSMALVAGAIVLWGLGLYAAAPQLFAGNDGFVGLSTTGTWLGIVLAMALVTGFSIVSLLRGLAARSTLLSTTA